MEVLALLVTTNTSAEVWHTQPQCEYFVQFGSHSYKDTVLIGGWRIVMDISKEVGERKPYSVRNALRGLFWKTRAHCPRLPQTACMEPNELVQP